MPLFKYEARDFSLEKKSGEINAKNIQDAKIQLKEQELIVINIKEIKRNEKEKKGINFTIGKPNIKLDEITLFSRQFATLIEAGVPITRSLDILSQNTQNKDFKKVLSTITTDIENGQSLSGALSKHKSIFPSIYIDMVQAAEMGGALPEVLNRLATYMESDKSIRKKVKGALTYPIAVSVIAVLAIVVLLIYVIPKFVPLFEDLGEELPLPTRILLDSSTYMQSNWWVLIVVAVVGFVSFNLYSKTTFGRKQIDYLKLKLPIVGQLVTKTAIARFSRTLETLQKSGVPLVQSLSIVGKTSGNVIIENALRTALSALEHGEGIANPLEESNVFPKLVTQMIAIGEETGELEQLLSKIADFYEEEVDMAVKSLTSLIEPAITVFLGVVVGFIAISVIMPIYNMMGALQSQM